MKHPANLRIWGEKVVLTTYKPEHVAKYNNWMGDEEILRLTGSERLTLDEEYEMQKDWENDPNKCTFIVLCRDRFVETSDEVSSMVGDTNLFMNQDPDEPQAAEIEIMIAEKAARRKGYANEALKLNIDYAKRNLNISRLYAKIKADNKGSIKLFEMLGFKYHSASEVFNEVCLVSDTENETIIKDSS